MTTADNAPMLIPIKATHRTPLIPRVFAYRRAITPVATPPRHRLKAIRKATLRERNGLALPISRKPMAYPAHPPQIGARAENTPNAHATARLPRGAEGLA